MRASLCLDYGIKGWGFIRSGDSATKFTTPETTFSHIYGGMGRANFAEKKPFDACT
jgi:hypothetical protein